MKTLRSIMSGAVAAATLAVAGSAAASVTVPYGQKTGFLFNDSTPQNTYIGSHDQDLLLTPPSGGDPGRTYESLFWGDDVRSREQLASSTPIVTSQNVYPFVWNASAAWWTTNGSNDSALKVLGLNGNVTSVHNYVAPDWTNPNNSLASGWVPISVVFHSNQTIYVDKNGLLTSGIVRSNLTVNSDMDPHDLPFSFFETPNLNSAYNCPDNSGVSCDLFQFSLTGYEPVNLKIGDEWYKAYFDFLYLSPGAFNITGNTSWGNGACKSGNFCILTKEGQVNYLVTGMLLVPEPASMALVGLGLVGLAAMRRRKVY